MPTKRALVIGVGSVDRGFYGGWSGHSGTSVNDADFMAGLLTGQGFDMLPLKPANFKRDPILAILNKAAQDLTSGDFFVLYFSGHGAQIPDHPTREADSLAETWCLVDGFLIDNEIDTALWQFKAGVRVLIISDSCNGGGIVQFVLLKETMGSSAVGVPRPCQPHAKTFPDEFITATLKARKPDYDRALALPPVSLDKAKASVMLLSASKADEDAYEGDVFSYYTGTLKDNWNHGAFHGSFADLQKLVLDELCKWQSPQIRSFGDQSTLFADLLAFRP